MPTRTPAQSGKPQLAYEAAEMIEARPATLPTERSNWPAISGSNRPRVSTASTDSLPTMLRKFGAVRKIAEVLFQSPYTAIEASSSTSRL